MRILEIALDNYCHIYNVPFQELKDLVDSDGTHFDDNINFILTEPPHDIQEESAMPSFKHNVLITNDMTGTLDLTADSLEMGGHRYVFCSKL